MAERMNNLTGKEWLQKSFTIWRGITKTKEERDTKHPALFPQKLVEELILIYTKDPEETILDPFLGIGSTLRAAASIGRSGIGIDLNPDFCEIARERVNSIPEDGFLTDVRKPQKIIEGDSRIILQSIPAESIDLVVTSPPYWNILNQKRTVDSKELRNYSASEDDLGNVSDYNDFLDQLKSVFTEVYKVLKPNKRCISVVMDIRKKDKFFPLHEDQSRIMREIGFELEEYVIWDRQPEYNNMKTLGYPWVFRFNKVHEYICIYWKR
jgi:DNA modification methylase